MQRTKSTQSSGRDDASPADVIVIGDGIIGLSTALQLAHAGANTCLVGARHEGVASLAAAGLLAPSIGSATGAARTFFDASLARYPAFLESLRVFDPRLDLVVGLIDVSDEKDSLSESRRLSVREVSDLEPRVHAPHGARLYPRDGAVDNVRIVNALRTAVAQERRIRWFADDAAVALESLTDAPRVRLSSGHTVDADRVILAAGAWAPLIAGLPRPLPVHPLKGQMLAVRSRAISHAVMSADVYLVPRDDEVLIGATVEHAGFDLTLSDAALDDLLAAAGRVVPELASAPVTRRWAGTRPATPDMLPIIGVEPTAPRLIYACGHSKNGILLAPQNAATMVELVQGREPELDISAFRVRG